MKSIVRTDDVLGGKSRLEDTRIGVIHVYRLYQSGRSPEEIASGYDIDVADVHNALAYAFDNPEEMREAERRAQELIERIRDERPVDPEDYKQQI